MKVLKIKKGGCLTDEERRRHIAEIEGVTIIISREGTPGVEDGRALAEALALTLPDKTLSALVLELTEHYVGTLPYER